MRINPPLYRHQSFSSLPAGITAAHIAETCRSAGVAFVNGVPTGWGKRELAHWFAESYAGAVKYASRNAHTPVDLIAHAGVDERDIDHVLLDARLAVITALEEAALPRGRASFVDNVLACRLVAPCNVGGQSGWVPADAPHLRLKSRVLALFAVDVLVRPEDYANALLVCHGCEAVVFGVEAVRRGNCGAHDAVVTAEPSPSSPSPSSPPPPDRHDTRPGLG